MGGHLGAWEGDVDYLLEFHTNFFQHGILSLYFIKNVHRAAGHPPEQRLLVPHCRTKIAIEIKFSKITEFWAKISQKSDVAAKPCVSQGAYWSAKMLFKLFHLLGRCLALPPGKFFAPPSAPEKKNWKSEVFWGNFSPFSWDFLVFRRLQYKKFVGVAGAEKIFPPTPPQGPEILPPGRT